jgi:ketosteroid isomerase-like protein
MLPPVDLEHERAALLELHASVRRAHFETDAEAVVAHDADEWINVRDATIIRRRRDEMAAFFREYFAGATYHEWDDVEPPIVSVSDDGTMAWMIVHVRVRRTADDGELRFMYAGIETYEKRDGRWVKVVEVGTFVEG